MKHEKNPACLPGLNAWAEWERHFQETDALIADRLNIGLPYVQHQRETCFVCWEHLERKAKSMPPKHDLFTFAPGEFTAWPQSSEYLRRPERRPSPAGSRRNGSGWAVIILVGCIFFGERVPGVHDALTAFVKAVLP